MVPKSGRGAQKGYQISVSANACGGRVVYSGHYIMTGFSVANSAQHPSECLRGGTFDCQLPSPEGSEYEHSLIK
jgi:hypothetical protein